MRYDKLVRDNIPEIIRGKGGKPVTHIADEAEYLEKLFAKLAEEVQEFTQEPSVEEFADIREVLDAIAKLQAFDPAEVARVQAKKASERGGFEKRIILDEA